MRKSWGEEAAEAALSLDFFGKVFYYGNELKNAEQKSEGKFMCLVSLETGFF